MLAPLPSTDRISMDQGLQSYHKITQWYQSWFSSIQYYLSAVGNNGTTAARPISGLYVGYPYFDNTLGIPIWCKTVNPVVWVNSAGSTV